MKFKQEQPPINIGADISVRSFEIIAQELKEYPEAKKFNSNEIEVISRLIHTSTCFKSVLENIFLLQMLLLEYKNYCKKKQKS